MRGGERFIRASGQPFQDTPVPSRLPVLRCASGGAVVVAEKAAEALPTLDVACSRQRTAVDQLVSQALVVAFAMVVRQILTNTSAKGRFADENQSIEALLFE